jgi:hypothetical protein
MNAERALIAEVTWRPLLYPSFQQQDDRVTTMVTGMAKWFNKTKGFSLSGG